MEAVTGGGGRGHFDLFSVPPVRSSKATRPDARRVADAGPERGLESYGALGRQSTVAAARFAAGYEGENRFRCARISPERCST